MSVPAGGIDSYPLLDYAEQGIAFIEQKIPDVDVLSVMPNQRVRPDGTDYDVLDIGWRMRPSMVSAFAADVPGAENVGSQAAPLTTTFYSHPDASKDWPHFALHEITLKASKVLSIYAGLSERVDLPSGMY